MNITQLTVTGEEKLETVEKYSMYPGTLADDDSINQRVCVCVF